MNKIGFPALLLTSLLCLPMAEANTAAAGKTAVPARTATTTSTPASAVANRPATRPAAAAKININTANAGQLASELNGVGQAKAEAIVAHRKQHGPFKSVAELTDVKGIGPAIVERNLDKLSVR